MKQFIEKTLHQRIEIKDYEDINKFPLTLRGSYDLYVLEISGQQCILAQLREEQGLAAIRKQQRRLQQLAGLYCVLYLKKMSSYQREKMLEEGIPFVWENHEIYMPFLGVLLKQNAVRTLKTYTKVSFLTQKMLLMALYNRWQDLTVTKAAESLGVSKMSITRCFDEIESLEIPLMQKEGRVRRLCSKTTKREMWDLIKPYMRNPLLQEFYLEKEFTHTLIKSGASALAEYSLLEDNKYKTYAVTKQKLAELNIREKKQIPKGEVPGCVIQELGYAIPFKEGIVIDPLTVFMLLEKEAEDPRIGIALDEMLEDYVW